LDADQPEATDCAPLRLRQRADGGVFRQGGETEPGSGDVVRRRRKARPPGRGPAV